MPVDLREVQPPSVVALQHAWSLSSSTACLVTLQPLISFAFAFKLLFIAASFHQHLQLSLLHIFAVI
ncbi:hypothetical protein SLEP1_g13730 [Rubroshorea leprosula]|uniref:Uncharacterized protein n=1 Tax=Rubroshorea leprosula TaxID=152421 RepID=A0AAV5ISA9_9ROSI|nr:hypothetical protein SLEP1_g13730 [Rubroshorea leprosula]